MARQAGQAVDQAAAEAVMPGVTAAAGDRDRVLQERAAGRSSVGGGQPARPGTMVWPAPTTKPVTSIAALQPAGQRGLDPGQPAASIPPDPPGNHGSPGDPAAACQRLPHVMAITVAEKVLIAGGVLNLAYGVLLGYPIVVTRARGAPATPRYLMAAHLSTLLHAVVLLGLVWAARLSALGPGWLEVAAWLVVVASALVAAKDTVNWLTGVQDEFGEKSRAALLGGLAALPETIGIGIFVVGVLKAL